MITYKKLSRIPSFEERFEFAKIGGRVGEDTFGYNRYLNQLLYHSDAWRRFRDQIIIRDDGCDLAHPDFPINGRIIIHHLKPVRPSDLSEDGVADWIFDPEMVVCVSHMTHEAIHYGDSRLLPKLPIQRSLYDTCPWKLRKGV